MMKTLRFLFLASFALACGDDDSAPIDSGPTADTSSDTGADSTTGEDSGEPACPTHLQLINVGMGSHNDLGWTGIGHNLRVNDESVSTVEMVNCDDECRRCEFRGPVKNSGIDNQRCLLDTRLVCESDADCGESGPCRFIQGPPLALDILGRPSCVLVQFVPDEAGYSIYGNINLESGAMQFREFHVESLTNVDAEGNPGGTCAQCVDDPTPNDGDPRGTCQNGVGDLPEPSPGLGNACDAHGFGSSLPGTYSFDCPPVRAVPSIDFDLSDFGTSGAVWTLDENRPACTNPMVPDGVPCWCGVCDGTMNPCESDSDCPGSTCGWWTPESGMIPTAPSGCADECVWDPTTATGTCTSAVIGIPVGCFPNTPGDTMEAPGSATVRDGEYFVTLGTLSCLPPAAIPTTNMNFGLPGPALYTQQYRVVPEFRTE